MQIYEESGARWQISNEGYFYSLKDNTLSTYKLETSHSSSFPLELPTKWNRIEDLYQKTLCISRKNKFTLLHSEKGTQINTYRLTDPHEKYHIRSNHLITIAGKVANIINLETDETVFTAKNYDQMELCGNAIGFSMSGETSATFTSPKKTANLKNYILIYNLKDHHSKEYKLEQKIHDFFLASASLFLYVVKGSIDTCTIVKIDGKKYNSLTVDCVDEKKQSRPFSRPCALSDSSLAYTSDHWANYIHYQDPDHIPRTFCTDPKKISMLKADTFLTQSKSGFSRITKISKMGFTDTCLPRDVEKPKKVKTDGKGHLLITDQEDKTTIYQYFW